MEYITDIIFAISKALQTVPEIGNVFQGLNEFDSVKNNKNQLNCFIRVNNANAQDVYEDEAILSVKLAVSVGARYTCDVDKSSSEALMGKLAEINNNIFNCLKRIDFSSVQGFQSRTIDVQFFTFHTERTIEIDYTINLNLIQE